MHHLGANNLVWQEPGKGVNEEEADTKMTSQVKVSVCLAVTYLAEQVVLWIKVQA